MGNRYYSGSPIIFYIMKKGYILLLFLFPSCILTAQKYDYFWTLGQQYYEPAGNTSGGMLLDFHQSPVEISFFESLVRFSGIAVISDSSGNLLAYSSGCNILNSEHNIMDGSENINEGDTHDGYCDDNGYPITQGFMFLPFPGHQDSYVLLHEWYNSPTSLKKKFFYSFFKITEANPAGIAVSINNLVKQDFYYEYLSAVQHANGRDWWIVLPIGEGFNDNNLYHIFLLDPTGVHFSHEQYIGRLWEFDYPGQSCFSPDGNFYARASPNNGLQVMDFDRCTGLLSNPRHAVLYDDVIACAGVAFAPNSRYLYANTVQNIYQHDMYVAGLEASQSLVAKYDTFYDSGIFSTVFYQEALAPDGKIYISVPNTVPYLHVIHQPDKKAPFCQVEQRGLPLPVRNGWTVPNIPHFRTGPVDGSACDTLGIDAPIMEPPDPPDTPDCIGQGLKIAPNPVSEVLYIGNYSCGEVSIYNVLGQLIKEMDTSQELAWDVRAIPSGVYYVVLRKDGRVVEVKPVVVSIY